MAQQDNEHFLRLKTADDEREKRGVKRRREEEEEEEYEDQGDSDDLAYLDTEQLNATDAARAKEEEKTPSSEPTIQPWKGSDQLDQELKMTVGLPLNSIRPLSNQVAPGCHAWLLTQIVTAPVAQTEPFLRELMNRYSIPMFQDIPPQRIPQYLMPSSAALTSQSVSSLSSSSYVSQSSAAMSRALSEAIPLVAEAVSTAQSAASAGFFSHSSLSSSNNPSSSSESSSISFSLNRSDEAE